MSRNNEKCTFAFFASAAAAGAAAVDADLFSDIMERGRSVGLGAGGQMRNFNGHLLFTFAVSDRPLVITFEFKLFKYEISVNFQGNFATDILRDDCNANLQGIGSTVMTTPFMSNA